MPPEALRLNLSEETVAHFFSKNFFGFWVLIFGFSACGGIPSSIPVSAADVSTDPAIAFLETKGETNYLQLSVSGLNTPSQNEAATIAAYKIVVERDGHAPLEQTISKEAKGLMIGNLPQGWLRRIRLMAMNLRGQVLREGEIENIWIESGVAIRLEMVLKAVPVFLNVFDGGYLSNRRLFFRLFSDPGHRLAVQTDRVLTDGLSQKEELPTDARGEALFYSADFSAGTYTFTVRDLDTEKFSTVTLGLWEGQGVVAAPLFAGGLTRADPPAAAFSRVGQTVIGDSQAGGGGQPGRGNFLADIASRLWNSR